MVLLQFLLISLTGTLLAQPEFYDYSCGKPDNFSTYTESSTFKANLDTTLSNLLTTNNGFGFYNISTGQEIDRVNALVYVEATLIQMCVKVVSMTPWLCNDTLLGNNEINFVSYGNGSQMTTNVDKFNVALRSLLEKLKAEAATRAALRKFASGNTTDPDFITIYAIMQCSPDLSKQKN
ncbi:gnk2-like domain-containing protein [Artemisia annua]|uniref:Gnk2-like domain-containing protein n=1 Tax=Artemisia annua TaxID=35608 RepID=A0A2U1MRE4_ARTAN|nr:gnk2-like domain-containing protein [Artemisia annua]